MKAAACADQQARLSDPAQAMLPWRWDGNGVSELDPSQAAAQVIRAWLDDMRCKVLMDKDQEPDGYFWNTRLGHEQPAKELQVSWRHNVRGLNAKCKRHIVSAHGAVRKGWERK